MADLMKVGIPPVDAGSLEQSQWFLNFYNIFQYENSIAEAELYK